MGAFVAAVLAASGCGSSGSESLSKAAFLKHGYAICHKRRQERTKAFEAKKPHGNELKAFIAQESIPPFRRMVQELEELSPPSGDEARVEAILASLEKAADDAEADPTSASILKANEEVTAYGLAECKF